jgi:hypothetical protein
MRFARRDHESFIGSYDPEHEMPDPDRGPRDRWQSDVYRHNAADGRWAYRWSPERIEDRGVRRPWRGDLEREIQPRDRYESRYRHPEYERGYEHGYYDRGMDMDRDRGFRGAAWDRDRDWAGDRDRPSGRGQGPRGDRFDRDPYRDEWDPMVTGYDRDPRGRGRY